MHPDVFMFYFCWKVCLQLSLFSRNLFPFVRCFLSPNRLRVDFFYKPLITSAEDLKNSCMLLAHPWISGASLVVYKEPGISASGTSSGIVHSFSESFSRGHSSYSEFPCVSAKKFQATLLKIKRVLSDKLIILPTISLFRLLLPFWIMGGVLCLLDICLVKK